MTHSNSKSVQARNSAIKELIARHTEEFEKIYGDARETRGLPRERVAPYAALRIENDRLRAVIAELTATST
jgi:hypothetical protein